MEVISLQRHIEAQITLMGSTGGFQPKFTFEQVSSQEKEEKKHNEQGGDAKENNW